MSKIKNARAVIHPGNWATRCLGGDKVLVTANIYTRTCEKSNISFVPIDECL